MARKRKRRRKLNPTPMQWGLLAVGTAVVVGVGVNRARKRKKLTKGEGVPACLEGIWGPRQALMPEIYDNVSDNARTTADQFFGFNLTPKAQGQIFEALAKIYVDDITTPAGAAAVDVMAVLAPCDWLADTWGVTMAEAMASAEALAMIVLADIQDVVIPFESPPVRIVADAAADACVEPFYATQPMPVLSAITTELTPAAASAAGRRGVHLNDEAQGAVFIHLAQLAATDQGTWLTAPIGSTLRTVVGDCGWERKDRYTQWMSDLWDSVEHLKEVVETDIMG